MAFTVALTINMINNFYIIAVVPVLMNTQIPGVQCRVSSPPSGADYVEVGNMNAHTKFSLSADARVRLGNASIYSPMAEANVTSGHERGQLLFDPRVWLPQGVRELSVLLYIVSLTISRRECSLLCVG